jgi:hypothetical protein
MRPKASRKVLWLTAHIKMCQYDWLTLIFKINPGWKTGGDRHAFAMWKKIPLNSSKVRAYNYNNFYKALHLQGEPYPIA